MKPLKMLGLAALTALMATAFLGAGSAMAATHLCAADEAVCASPLTHVHETSVGKAILLASTKIECNVLFLGEVVGEGESGVAVVEGNFTYSSCTSGCTVTEEGGPSVVEVEKAGHETASVVGEGEVHVSCVSIDCYFNGKGLAGTAKGPLLSTQKNGEVSLQEQSVHKTKGASCPETGKLDITTTPLSATYISMRVPTALCGADEAACASPLTHVHETSVGKAILLASPKIECNVLFLGEVEAGQAVVEGNFTYSSCGSGCTVTEQSASSGIKIVKAGHETASVVGEGEVHVNCIGINCYFNGKGLLGTAKGPLLSTQKNGEVSLQEQSIHKTKGTFCPSTGKLDITTTPLSATYISTSGSPNQTALCGADEEVCAAPLTHVHETSVGKAILLASPKIECSVLFLGEVVGGGEAGQAEVAGNFTYSSCTSGCTVTEEGGPSVVEVEKAGHETASVVGEGEVHVSCVSIDCYFNGKGLAGTAKGPLLSTAANGEVSLQEQSIHKTKGTSCPSTGKLDITTTPLSATYITE